jgi:LysM repeat protein
VYHVGDSLVRIARDHGLTVEQLALANGLRFDTSIADGTRLVIPLGAAGRKPAR